MLVYFVKSEGDVRLQLQNFPDSMVSISSKPFVSGKHFKKIDTYQFNGDDGITYEIHLQLTEIGSERFQLATQNHLLEPYVIMASNSLISYRVVSSAEPQKLFFIKSASKRQWKQWIKILENELRKNEANSQS